MGRATVLRWYTASKLAAYDRLRAQTLIIAIYYFGENQDNCAQIRTGSRRQRPTPDAKTGFPQALLLIVDG
jgi:hypothetical protein